MARMFESVRIGQMTLKNRFVHSATHEAMAAADGATTEAIVARYAKLAKGGIGLIIPGHLYIHPWGQAHGRQSGIHDDTMIPGLKKLADAVHAHDGKVAFQLAHGGRQCTKAILGRPPLAPSGNGRDPVSLNKAKPMDAAVIEATIDAFVSAARRAAEAGADAVQLHAAHGYLINEFLSPFFNRRKDGWGGAASGRFRFLKEIVLRIQQTLPADMPVLVKLNTNDFTPRKGLTPDLAATYAKWLVEIGVAAVEISCGTYYGFHTIRGEIPAAELLPALPVWMRPVARIKMRLQAPGNRFQEAYNLGAAKTIKPVMNGVPLILVGGLRRLANMEDVLEKGYADLIAMSRPFIREPSLVNRFATGKATEASCISCNNCFAAMFREIPVKCYQHGLPA